MDATIVRPDSAVGLEGLRLAGTEEPDYARALEGARRRKEDAASSQAAALGVDFKALCFTVNGKAGESTKAYIRGVAKDWALRHGCSAGDALRRMRGRISTEIHRWNGMILWDACRHPVESDRPDVGEEGREVEATEDGGAARRAEHEDAGGHEGDVGGAHGYDGDEAEAGEARESRGREASGLHALVCGLLGGRV